MGRVAITSDVWTDVRFARFQEIMAWPRAKALGVLAILWANSRIVGKETFLPQEIGECLACSDDVFAVTNALIRAGYVAPAKPGADGQDAHQSLVIIDNAQWHCVANRLRANASKGGLARAAATKSRKARKKEAIDTAFSKAQARQTRRLKSLEKRQISH